MYFPYVAPQVSIFPEIFPHLSHLFNLFLSTNGQVITLATSHNMKKLTILKMDMTMTTMTQ